MTTRSRACHVAILKKWYTHLPVCLYTEVIPIPKSVPLGQILEFPLVYIYVNSVVKGGNYE